MVEVFAWLTTSTRPSVEEKVEDELVRDVAALVTVCEEGGVPLHRRDFGWAFFGGKREEGESIGDACERKAAEELGVRVAVGDAVHVQTHGRWRVHTFVVAV